MNYGVVPYSLRIFLLPIVNDLTVPMTAIRRYDDEGQRSMPLKSIEKKAILHNWYDIPPQQRERL